MHTKENENSEGGKRGEAETRQRILAAASQLMAQKGFKGATTRKISELAGVNEVTIFRHFTNKQGLAVALLNEALDIREPLEKSLQGDFSQIREMLIHYARTYYNLLVDRKELTMICVIEADNYPEVGELFSKVPLSAIQLLGEKLQHFQDEGHLPPWVDCWSAAAMFLSVCFQAFMAKYRLHVTLPSTEEHLFEQTTDILLYGLLSAKEK
ncbi:TetR/AcrR family transcriptional regulator [Brevibacillus sp. TJ4]|uniref:TetR/AcrR family transcriptional regulator n=1 Tax=Brevibacillus sp. TJ4 TaxID=3234853 RepID=UPI0037CF5072